MVEELLLRRCSLHDIPALAKLKTKAWTHPLFSLPSNHPLVTAEWSDENWWVEQMGLLDSHFWVLIHRDTDDMVAVGGWKEADERPDTPQWIQGKNAFLYTLAVHPLYRGQSYGQTMTQIRLADAKRQGYDGAFCHAYEGNKVLPSWQLVGAYTEDTGLAYNRYYQRL